MTTTELSVREGRRRWSAAEKGRIVAESLAAGANAAVVARRHHIHPSMIYAWRRQVRASDLSAAKGKAQFVPVSVSIARDSPTTSVRGLDVGSAIEVALRNGRVLRVPDGVAPGRASALADALEGFGR